MRSHLRWEQERHNHHSYTSSTGKAVIILVILWELSSLQMFYLPLIQIWHISYSHTFPSLVPTSFPSSQQQELKHWKLSQQGQPKLSLFFDIAAVLLKKNQGIEIFLGSLFLVFYPSPISLPPPKEPDYFYRETYYFLLPDLCQSSLLQYNLISMLILPKQINTVKKTLKFEGCTQGLVISFIHVKKVALCLLMMPKK